MNETNPLPAATPWWRQPIGMGLLGLALMIGGWKLSTWTPAPPTAHEQAQADKLAELKRMQGDTQWKARVEDYARNVRQPPYEMAGRLIFFAGLVVFILAAVRMYQTPAAPQESESESAGENDYEESIRGDGGSG
jgi:hypothetical protein